MASVTNSVSSMPAKATTMPALIESVWNLTCEPTHSQPIGCGPQTDTHMSVSISSRNSAKPRSACWRTCPASGGLGR